MDKVPHPQRAAAPPPYIGRAARRQGIAVTATIMDKSFDLVWQAQATVSDPDSEQYATKVVDVQWAYYTTAPVNPYHAEYPDAYAPLTANDGHDHLTRSIAPGALKFSLAGQEGALDLKTNDAAALQEYTARCALIQQQPPPARDPSP